MLKFALVNPSADAGHDLDYRFAQCLPGAPEQFDLGAGCGHSMLASVAALGCRGPVRVRMLNTGERAVCSPDGAGRLRLRFVHDPPLPTRRLLTTGRPVDSLSFDGRLLPVSLVALGNPYVFVDAARLGFTSLEALTRADHRLLRRLERLRGAAARRFGLHLGRTLPKIAVVGAFRPGRLAVRAVTVPGWHPGIALTGAACLAAACAVEGTLPHALARASGCSPAALHLDTPGGPVLATADTGVSGSAGKVLYGTGVGRKRATVLRTYTDLARWRTYATA
ncbi:PrpF domain-containing protein [Streptomyces oceani]|uniref:PrpF domain-containing protein n=1 Tax=Streptomyces oceani TaxID=1075402 RepID=UPI00147D4A71|nr:PrpF domain-containing protein [Streptomyces oceani]